MKNQSEAKKVTLRIVVHGHVQGVFFRDSMRREAQGFDVCGWVRNNSDGTVEAMLQGEQSAVDSMVQWAHHGPERARVERVVIEQAAGEYIEFEIQY